MTVIPSTWRTRFRQRSDAFEEAVGNLLQKLFRRCAPTVLRRKLEADSIPATRYWSHIESEVARHVRQEYGDPVHLDEYGRETTVNCNSAWDDCVHAQELARAIEVARIDCIERQTGLRPEDRRQIAPLSGSSGRTTSNSPRQTSARTLRLV
jgi:hypothetical protein